MFLLLLLRKRMLCFEPSLPKKNKQQIKTFKNALLQLGVAVGFVLPPMLVPNSEDINQVGSDLQMMFYLVAGLTSILLVLMAICKRWQQQLFAINQLALAFCSLPGSAADAAVCGTGGVTAPGGHGRGAGQLLAIAEESDDQSQFHILAALLWHQCGRILCHLHAAQSGTVAIA